MCGDQIDQMIDWYQSIIYFPNLTACYYILKFVAKNIKL